MVKLHECPVCSGNQFSPYLQCVDHTVSQESFTIMRCSGCGFLLTSPRPENSDLGKYYKSEQYISHSNTSKGWVNRMYKLARRFTLAQKFRLVNPYAQQSGLLDIGCGTGAFLNYCAEKGLRVEGVEPDDDARRFAQSEYGFALKTEEELDTWAAGQFSAITMWHVLEHVPNLQERIAQLKRLLDAQGRVFVAVPNHRSADAQYYKEFWAAYDVPRHLWHFSPSTIRSLFNKQGFVLERTLPMKLDAYYVSLLSERYRNGSALNALWQGFRSNWKAGDDQWSSQIYVFKK
jgi:2-polyprenyl-3-methyl-5-hydroxy-6-metoxy-1,4-benzoquinol methylase